MGESESFFWLEAPVGNKRKVRTKKLEYDGWGSRQLIQFLQSIGSDTSKQISQYDVTSIITKYINNHNLNHPKKKKRILCDERLISLFGRKSISRIKIHDMLGPHFAENVAASDDDFSYSSEGEDFAREPRRDLPSGRKTRCQKKVLEHPKSSFAAIVPDNIKLVYLKRSLVQELLNDQETFDGKLLGSFVRIKSDPNDYLQKNSYLLVQVTGLKRTSGVSGNGAEIILEVSNFVKDVRISILSDDNFSEEECEDLHQRVKDGLLRRPTIWLVAELALLQKLIDRANEKGWRKELNEYLERRKLLQMPNEQSRLLHEVPKVIGDEVEVETLSQGFPENSSHGNHCSPKSCFHETSELSVSDVARNDCGYSVPVKEQQKEPAEKAEGETNGEMWLVGVEEKKQQHGDVEAVKVIDLSDDEEKKGPIEDQIGSFDPGSFIWYYLDPQGEVQGPFSISSLKRWKEADYFPADFKIWRAGQSQKEAVLLSETLKRLFPN
uniref:Uncharacterized protein At5g08430 isoform X1 n=1 Tax=Rhizophora mucronata TaxID=61149 RepID=A0A2P2KIK3_RHIMU